jgi:hypothetical protein
LPSVNCVQQVSDILLSSLSCVCGNQTGAALTPP